VAATYQVEAEFPLPEFPVRVEKLG
jgi:hypothetical protein